jgi:hypothetical protein
MHCEGAGVTAPVARSGKMQRMRSGEGNDETCNAWRVCGAGWAERAERRPWALQNGHRWRGGAVDAQSGGWREHGHRG